MSAPHSSASPPGPIAEAQATGVPAVGLSGPDAPEATPSGSHRRPATGFDYAMDADSRLIAGVRAALREWLSDCGVDLDDRDSLVLACSEAIANSIEHAYEGRERGAVRVSGHCDGRTVELSVHDDGAWIPPRMRNPEHSGQLRGRGLPLISHLMDATELDTDAGTTVTMRRRLRHPRRH